MLSCKHAAELMSRRMDEELPLSQRMGLRLHLMLCKGCRNFSRQMDILRQVSRKFPHRDD